MELPLEVPDMRRRVFGLEGEVWGGVYTVGLRMELGGLTVVKSVIVLGSQIVDKGIISASFYVV